VTDFILDQPNQIRAFLLLQVYYKLKMEVEAPTGPKWRESPMNQAIELLRQAGVPYDGPRTKKAVLSVYAAYLEAIGLR
jgi:hypothetical protein